MTTYIVRRILITIPILIGISIITFGAIHLAPGDPASLLLDPTVSPEDRERMAVAQGLRDPVHIQYVRWIGDMFQGDFGYSYMQRRPVLDILRDGLPNTLMLTVSATLFAVILAIPFGIISATRQYSKTDYTLTVGSFIGVATPNFWLGLMVIMFLSVKLGWFPAGGVQTLGGGEMGGWASIKDRLHHLILPMIVLGTSEMAGLTRYTRSSMLDVVRQDFIRTARAKGLREKTVILKHGLRNGLIPIITIFGLMIPNFIGGSVVVETVFSYPGLGRLFVESVFQRDYPIIMALTMLTATLVVLGNLIADILYAIFDPRIEY